MRTTIILIIAVVIGCTGCFIAGYGAGRESVKHGCKYDLCPFKTQYAFVSGCGACEAGSDCWKLDSLHMVYPDAEYDEIEQLINN